MNAIGWCRSRRSVLVRALWMAVVVALWVSLTSATAAGADGGRRLRQSRMPVPLYSAAAQSDGEVLYLTKVGFEGLGQMNAFEVPQGTLLRQNTVMPGYLFDLAIDTANGRLYASDGWGIHAFSASDMSYAGYIDVGASITSLAFDPSTGRLFVGVRGLGIEGDRAVFVVDPATGSRLGVVAEGAVYATNLAVDRRGGRVLIGEHNRIRIVDASTLATVADFPSADAASDSLYALDGDVIYVAGKRTSDVKRLEAGSGKVLDSITLGEASALALADRGRTLWVAHRRPGTACTVGEMSCAYVVSMLDAKRLQRMASGEEAIVDYSYPQYHRLSVVGRRVVFTALRSPEAVIS